MTLEDEKIVGLFLARNELALSAAEQKYGKLLISVSRRVLGSEEDAAECLNDALFALWSRIPPESPRDLRAYACKIIRNISFDRLKRSLAQKRSKDSEAQLDELEASLSDGSAQEEFDRAEFSILLDGFLRQLRPESRVVFLKRYFFLDSEPQIAADLGMSLSKVKSLLHRARSKFRETVYKEETEK